MKIYSSRRNLTIASLVGQDIWLYMPTQKMWVKFLKDCGDSYLVHNVIADNYWPTVVLKFSDKVRKMFYRKGTASRTKLLKRPLEHGFEVALREHNLCTTAELFGLDQIPENS